ncbi:M24 family metallopeptidase [Microbacterium betulae]|uniref:M24 family metallopeptidase n=1 Tax=Microbacterium betulae TaxID=2981139 RepID=A0AA97I6V7_9MICO|nr:M24 family metallopeptidase [Microbacterium sp. AB]WOF24254.1 M24 family metallopeptidase [Microbacterium sp. AB]
MPPSPTADRPHKRARLAAILDARDAEAILLTAPENLAWFFDGARTSVPYGGAAVFSAIVRRDGSAVVTAPANEAARLAEEEVGGAEIRAVDWYADLAGAEPGVLHDTDAVEELRAARAALLPVERERYRALGRETARAMTAVLRDARPRTSERDLAGELARAVVAAGADPVTILVAGEGRTQVQHPLPTRTPLGRRAMAVVSARRHGLHVSLTRWVRFGGGAPDTERAIREVEADAFAATRPGRELRAILSDIAASYERHGLGSPSRPAWLAHHQGGPTGYLGRDPKAGPASTARVATGQAFAWNPWAPHVKIEDTVVVDDSGLEVLTVDPAWPTVGVRGVARPVELDLS